MTSKTYYRVEFLGIHKQNRSETFSTLSEAEEHANLRQIQRAWKTIEIYKITEEVSKELLKSLPGILPPSNAPPNTKAISFRDAGEILENCKHWTRDGILFRTHATFGEYISFKHSVDLIEHQYTEEHSSFFVSTDPAKPFLGISGRLSGGVVGYTHIFIPSLGEP